MIPAFGLSISTVFPFKSSCVNRSRAYTMPNPLEADEDGNGTGEMQDGGYYGGVYVGGNAGVFVSGRSELSG